MTYQPSWLKERFPKCKQVNANGKCPHCPEWLTPDQRYKKWVIAAHSHKNEICFIAPFQTEWNPEYPTPTFLHEYAHILTFGDDEHGYEWRLTFLSLLRENGYDLPIGKYGDIAYLSNKDFTKVDNS